MIQINCCLCGKSIDEKGGLLCSPPDMYADKSIGQPILESDLIHKYHVCNMLGRYYRMDGATKRNK